MGLGSLIKEEKLGSQGISPSTVKKLLKEHFRQDEPKLPLQPGGVLRASAFASLCPREEILCAVNSIVRADKVEPDLNLIFAHGTGLHHVIQNKVLPSVPQLLVGRWKCLGCGKAVGPDAKPKKFDPKLCIPRPDSCLKCKTREFIYEELHLHSHEYRLGGHPDGFLNIPGLDGLGVLEAKSIGGGRAWKVKNVPDMGHVIQAHIYMWLTDLRWSVILYWDKATNGLDGLIEHYVERDDDTIEHIKASAKSIFDTLDPWWEASAVAGAAGAAKPPLPVLPERICGTVDCERAKACAVAKLCFATP